MNKNQWTTAAQDDGEWRKMTEQEVERFMVKWIAAEKARAGLRYSVVFPNATGRIKERTARSKRARAGLPAVVDWPQVV